MGSIQFGNGEEMLDVSTSSPLPVQFFDLNQEGFMVRPPTVADVGNIYLELWFEGGTSPTNSYKLNVPYYPYGATGLAIAPTDLVDCTLTLQAKQGSSWLPVYDCEGNALTIGFVAGRVIVFTGKWMDAVNCLPEWRFVSSVAQTGQLRLWHR